MVATTLPRLLTPGETAAAIGVCPATLSIWRCTKRYNLPYVKVGRLVRYRATDVIDFLEQRRVTPSSQPERNDPFAAALKDKG